LLRKSAKRKSKLDPFKNDIIRLLDKHPYTSAQILCRLKEMGYNGGYSIVKDYIKKIRPKQHKAFLTLSFAPGECAQVDWGSYGTVCVGSAQRRLSFFVMVLCYSRMMYLEFTVSQTMEHFLACHQNAFSFFNGVPQKIMVDNLKSAVLSRPFGATPVFNPKYKDFADHCGFAITPCNVGKANEKGRVENAVGYVKKNFLAGLNIPNFAAINLACQHWLNSVANVRIHGATRQKPADLLEKEKSFLKSLPTNHFDIANITETRASSQFRISLESNRYSVPAQYAGAQVTLKTYPDRLCIYTQDKLIARHTRSYDKNKDIEDPDHPKELLKQRKKAGDQKIFMRFLNLSSKAESYWNNLEKRRMNPHHHVRNIVALSEIYGEDAVCRAIEDALFYQAFSSEYIANILEQRKRKIPKPGALHLMRNEDLLDLSIEQPDLNIYQPKKETL